MNYREYSVKRDGEKYITKNIQIKELRSKDGSDYIKIDYVVCCVAQYVRDVYNRPLHINSAYRSFDYNVKVGGAAQSRHTFGCALDTWLKDVKQQDLANLVYSMGLVRVGVYNSFVHFDTDRSPVWLSQGSFKKVNVPYLNRVISKTKNNKDYLVAIIQYRLNCLGFNCGKEDGIAGSKFDEAVKKFQKAKGLSVDGAVGENTWNKLFN